MPNYGLLAQQGRREDNAAMGGQVAHISALESELLRLLGGAGTTNPMTGLPEYYKGPAGTFSVSTGTYGGPGPGTGPGSSAALAATKAAKAAKTKTVTTNWGDLSQAPLAPTSPSAPPAPEAAKMFTKLGKTVTNSPLSKVSMVSALLGLGLSTLGMSLANTGGYTSAGSPGGVIPDSKPNLLPLADVIAAPKPVEGEQFVLESDQKALEEAELLELALLELLPNIEGLTPEVSSIMQQFVEEKRALGSIA